MSTIGLTLKGARLLELSESAGFESVEKLLQASFFDTVCPAICMECGHTAQMEKDQRAGHCQSCGRNKMMSGFVLAGLI